MKVYNNVSELTKELKNIVDKFSIKKIQLQGEITNFKISNNNLYASLKDNESSINIIIWDFSYKNELAKINNGEKIIATGKLSYYKKTGNVCFIISKYEKNGHNGGINNYEYENIKKKYELLGYFKKENKKIFPKNINKIGIVTALNGAALQDILYVFEKNCFNGKIVIKGCNVQGLSAPKLISNAITTLEKWKDQFDNKSLDIIIITRGGGSFEDLIAFSSPIVIETIKKCTIYTMSAIGHEIDHMLSDDVADISAPTPSIGAENICKHEKNKIIKYQLLKQDIINQFKNVTKKNIRDNEMSLLLINLKIKELNPEIKIDQSISNLNLIKKNVTKIINSSIKKYYFELEKYENKLSHYSIDNILNAGYAIIINDENDQIIKSIHDIDINIKQKLKIKLKDGELIININYNL